MNASAYCQRLKSLTDQLKNVGAPVSDSRMVLQMVGGLTRAYCGVGTIIRQSNPLPPFYKARSMLVLEESGLAKEAATEFAMVAASIDDGGSEKSGHSKKKHNGGSNSGGWKNNSAKKNTGGGRGGSSGTGGGGKRSQLGGSGGQQPDPAWYMNTGATSHMTFSYGNLSSYFNLSNHPNNNIVVGNGHTIPILGYGQSHLSSSCQPLSLKNVLHAPKLIKNLISVRKFTTDNSVSVEFDPFGFFVKDYRTGKSIMRSNSRGELYPIGFSSSHNNQALSSTFAAVTPKLWHDRLGHGARAG